MWGVSNKKSEVTSNEIRFKYDKNNRVMLESKGEINTTLEIERKYKKMTEAYNSKKNSMNSINSLTLSSNEVLIQQKLKMNAKNLSAQAKFLKDESTRPRQTYIPPDHYTVNINITFSLQ